LTADHSVSRHPSWSRLREHAAQQDDFRIVDAFAADPQRLERLSAEGAGLRLDLSRTLISATTLELLLALADDVDLVGCAHALMAGEPLNNTEARPALHTALRGTAAPDGGVPYADEVGATRDRMRRLTRTLHDGTWVGYDGAAIRDVVNIGIGGSHLGPAMVVDALQPYQRVTPRCHFVSNVDPADLDQVLARVDAPTTLFVVASKSFSTLETLENARSARRWLLDSGCPPDALGRHFIAVSARPDKAQQFGIDAEQVYPMWDWVGGRYSLWSAIGLTVELALGSEHFDELLAGARAMDEHFRDAPPARNLPMLAALASVWHRNFLGYPSVAVIPYDQGLRRLPEYLQQLVMESNGKSVDREGRPLACASSGVLWGAAGTNGQHSFHQLLHQGTAAVNVDFVLPYGTHSANVQQHSQLVANCLSQSQALMLGRSKEQALETLRRRGLGEAEAQRLAPHLRIPGNRPSSTVSMAAVTPSTLGALIALYEHRTFCEGMIWGINSFDQFGVELGKELSQTLHPMLTGESDAAVLDPSTRSLVEAYRARTPKS
jgi:glucose-6-phosphate isomerase